MQLDGKEYCKELDIGNRRHSYYKTPVQKIFFAQMNMPHHHPALRETSNFHFLEVTPLFYEVQDFL